MDIQIISKSCAKIILTKEETEQLEIGFDSFEKDNPEIKTFLGYIMAVMNDMGVITSPKDKISVEVFELEQGDMIIYVSASPPEETTKFYPYAVLCSYEPIEIIKFLDNHRSSDFIIKDNASLYFYNDLYCLIFQCHNSEKKILSQLPFLIFDDTFISKVKEYGRLICNTPFESLI